jgi:hypothetical protein
MTMKRKTTAPPQPEPVIANTFTSRNMLVNFTISSFHSRKKDKKITSEVAAQHGVSEKVGDYRKSLFPFDDKDLDAIPAKIAQARVFHRTNTLPWGNGDSDLRVLPAANFLAYADGVRKYGNEIRELAQNVANRLPELKATAKTILNGMYNESEYPDAATFVAKHDLRKSFLPIPEPENAERIEGLDADQIEDIRAGAQAELMEAQTMAMRELWERLFKVVSHASTMIGDKKRTLRDSLFENIQAMCDILPRLNFENDPQIAEIARELKEKVGNVNPAFVRKSVSTRRRVAADVAEIERKMAFLRPQKKAA